MDHERAKVAVIATNRNIAYADVAVGQTQSNFKELEHEYICTNTSVEALLVLFFL